MKLIKMKLLLEIEFGGLLNMTKCDLYCISIGFVSNCSRNFTKFVNWLFQLHLQ